MAAPCHKIVVVQLETRSWMRQHEWARDDVGNAVHPPASFKMRRDEFVADNASSTTWEGGSLR